MYIQYSAEELISLPARHQVFICCDGASKGNPRKDGFGFVERTYYGSCAGAASGGLGIATNYLAEVMALIVGGEWAVSKKMLDVCFRLDSNAVLVAFNSGKIPWMVVNRWKNIVQSITSISFRHSYRKINSSVGTMAKKGALLERGEVIYYDTKPTFLGVLEREDGIYFRFC
ncbi:uncharacterized protein LOC113312731 [Papaver somniferum]|uniref:uncharacterized protein LOC113312731 n=1 Tax=Papaver somniferum TaxID=3469 RepID=UPI000E6FC0FD|nr:uncharacterized protein LOC113312731 [Papaver somniferum]